MDKELAVIISEYLTSRGYLQTVASFQTELQHRPIQAPPTQTARLQHEFIAAFENGNRAKFFDLWNRNVPQTKLERDPTCQNLEFNLSVYFAVYPIKTGNGDKSRSFREFTDYLRRRSAVLCKNPDLTPFCALPYIPNPTTHPTLKEIFAESWSSDLKSRLLHFLKLSLKSQPRLLSLYLTHKVSSSNTSAQEVLYLREQLSQSQKQYSQRVTDIQASYHTLVGIAMELLDTLESAIAGRPITPSSIQNICTRLFSNSLPNTVAPSDIRPNTATAILRQSVISMRESVQAPVDFPTSTPLPKPLPSLSPQSPTHSHTLTPSQPQILTISPTHDHTLTSSNAPSSSSSSSKIQTHVQRTRLDFGKLKNDLERGNNEKKALLLQALRWRLTHSPNESHYIMDDYIINDLLGCTNSNEAYHAHLTTLLKSSSLLVCEQFCRLLNAMSSLATGRVYLSKSGALVFSLCGKLMEQSGDREGGRDEGVEGKIGRNALGAVQKLSLRRPLQGLMIECGLPQWVAGVIGREEGVSDYTLRYCLALLVNLSLRSAGRRACVDVSQLLLRTLGELLEHEDEEICSYVNGILYSLLSLPKLKADARRMGMGDMLSSALEGSPPELREQINYIIQQLHSDTPTSAVANDDDTETPPSDDSAEEEEEDEETDVIEGDEDEVAIATSLPVGESLLAHYEMNSEIHVSQQIANTSSRKVLEAPFMRPVTPQSHPVSRSRLGNRDCPESRSRLSNRDCPDSRSRLGNRDCPESRNRLPGNRDCPDSRSRLPGNRDCPDSRSRLPGNRDCPDSRNRLPGNRDCPDSRSRSTSKASTLNYNEFSTTTAGDDNGGQKRRLLTPTAAK